MAKRLFDAIDEKIVRTLYQQGIPLTRGKISKLTGISWVTVKKHIEKLLHYKLVQEVTIETSDTPKIVFNFQEFGQAAMQET